MTTVVQKYGGTSVGSIEKIINIAKKISKRKENGENIIVVVSAMGKTTDNLLNMANQISNNPCKRELDMLISTGEQVSIALLSIALKEKGYDSVSLTGPQAGIMTEGFHTKAKITDINIKNIKKYLSEEKIVVIAGFQGINDNGDITTLGRGGSDTTAVALASKLKCTCEIYTDVDGVYSVDPRAFPTAKKLEYISYEEMMEMAKLGASIMEPRAVEIGQKFNVPIYITLSDRECKGTYIKELDVNMEKKVITGLTVSDDDLLVTINHFPYNAKNVSYIFGTLAEQGINVDMISQTAPHKGYVNISFTCPKDDRIAIEKLMDKFKSEINDIMVEIESNITKLSVVGLGMVNHPGVAAKMFKVFADNNIQFKQVTTSEIRISYAIDVKDKQKAIIEIANEFNL